MAEVLAPYTDEQLVSDAVSKKDLVTFLQENGSTQFLTDRKLKGAAKNVIKTKTKEHLVDDYKELFLNKSFKSADDAAVVESTGDQPQRRSSQRTTSQSSTGDVDQVTDKAKKLEIKPQEAVKYTKRILKMGDQVNYPKKGDDVACFYTGKLDNGKVFDSNTESGRKGKKALPLRFKVGVGKVIRGWDEALLNMSKGERAEIVIQPEWAYGKKGLEGKIPANSTLTFEVELVGIE